MNKFLFVAGIFSFSIASAQQDDFFDIQKHLEKKNKKNIIIPWERQQIKSPERDSLTFSLVVHKQATLSHILPNGNKVYGLPGGNMPCIVPNMNQFNMPVILFDSIPGTMPNVWPNRFKIIPE